MPYTNEEQILEALQAGDRPALRHIFDAHYEMVCQAIMRLVQDRSTSEDLAQEVFIRFWEKRAQIQIKTSLSAYLRRMAINEGLMYLRRQKRWETDELEAGREAGAEVSGEDVLLQDELGQRIRQAIQQLPPRCRAVFQLSRYEELTYKEIADQLGISVKTVEHQMGKALRVLKERLRAYLHFFF